MWQPSQDHGEFPFRGWKIPRFSEKFLKIGANYNSQLSQF